MANNMIAYFNGAFINEEQFSVGNLDRAFQYGDGLFETIAFRKGKIMFLDKHFERLTLGAKALSFEIPTTFNQEYLEKNILALIEKNALNEDVRIKLIVWRKEGGLFTPTNNQINYFIKVAPLAAFAITEISKIGIYKDFRLHYSPISQYKTLNALPYILASNYKKQHQFDEVILFDNQGNIAEGSASNIFWIENGTLFTPSLQTGCLAGVMRHNIIQKATQLNIPITEVLVTELNFETLDCVFFTNACSVSVYKIKDDRAVRRLVKN